MEVKLEPSTTSATAALSKLSPEGLLLLGLQLLSKNKLNAPGAAVLPRPPTSHPTSPLQGSPLNSTTPPSSPEQHQQVPQSSGRKRKRGESNEELSDREKREKRKMMNRIAAQNARDRKKTYVDDLERKVAELETKNQKLQQENQTLREKTDALTAEKRQLETQLHLHQNSSLPSSPSEVSDTCLGSSLGNETLSESGSAVPSTSLQQKQILGAILFAQVLVTFDSLVHLLQDNWPEYGIVTCGGSHDPLANVRCQSHDFHQPLPQEAGVVGGQAINMEPTGTLSSNAFLGLSDPLTAVSVYSEEATSIPPLSDSTPINHKHCPISAVSDIPDAELAKMISPFTTASDSDFDPDYFDIESFMAA